ncbi:hypothetical protein [uncultured Phascolarctobacterium sp.]|uniref:hypothetical protein n=1 Tax=uncultured Phascolarctobacterium sp. TaxID=512296 RepID=UPI00260C25D1|nr:hypothetical protein [uncultured Phascolarctobacterium sp.]
MRLGKKLFSCFSLLALGIMCFFAAPPQAQAAEFLTPDKSAYLYMNTRELDIRYDNEEAKFILRDDGVLQLTSQDGKAAYLALASTEKDPYAASYTIRKFGITNSKKAFYEIHATAGAHEQTCGYWIIGKHEGQWVTYISLESLVPMGYDLNGYHQLHSRINENNSGRLLLGDAIIQFEFFWDDAAQWFGVRRI